MSRENPDRIGSTPTDGKPVVGNRQLGEWHIRKLQLFTTCFFCGGLLKKNERCYVKAKGNAGRDLYSHLGHGDPTDWNMQP